MFDIPTFRATIKRLEALKRLNFEASLDRAARAGLDALVDATPVDTGAASASWYYTIDGSRGGKYTIKWFNSQKAGSVPLVVLLDLGHATGTGGYVPGIRFIGPAVKPVYSDFRKALRREVHKR